MVMSMKKIVVRTAASGAEGDGAEVNRLFPIPNFMNFDPFVLWDEFTIRPGAGFPDHPHRGFEGITYLIKGSINHTDNLGNNSTVYKGGMQRFTAGRGIVHSEMPSSSDETSGIQLWVNLPAELKKLAPAYQQVDADEIRVVNVPGGRVRLLSGEDTSLKLHTRVIYQDVELSATHRYSLALDPGMRGFVYVLSGQVTIENQVVNKAESCFIEDRTQVEITANTDARCMLCFGVPHNQPINQHGSFVD
jgi:redox-sensitive bicupin YhaK (pirin superfamily)